ncbi:isoleucine--tRNA ligase [Tropilaelaps mercedesae]|uniref:Isoleucine--tRNA ligase, cytoplasmic n=1 Tax=Tropilaelaps mercedesae TaxID=418985 RepID=A0A1V9WYX2_9ACAR|nr:isoleucine--tRNA ligase [Tropilaelaps mercedesae]
MEQLPEKIDFPGEEQRILELWNRINAFKTCLKLAKGKTRFTFYDGPPFATGLPHYGHLLAGTIKDIIPRFAHQSGFYVERRFGWDCHGLPVEYEIDKLFNIKGPEDVARMGIAAYNDECRKIVMRYSNEWRETVTRLGRWIDFDNDYKTMYPSFMESVWWVFKQLYNKGYVYKGVKVMPYSTACNTPLSNFEAGQNYKEVVDPAIIVSFPLDEDPKVSLIAWTTTPWTLPSNLAICVNPQLTYVKVEMVATGAVYILMECRLSEMFKNADEYKVLDKFTGETLKGKSYKPLFPYFAHLKENGAFRVLCDGYVTEDSGTGVVHQAPYFGEDDYRTCLANGVITKDQEIVCPLESSGRFIDPVTDFKGMYIKDADKDIVASLKKQGRLVQAGTTKHSYPFCWRSDTPLLYRAIPSWFIRVEHMNQKLLSSNAATYWVPDFVKEKRFGNWLKDARDWAISRNRYWGTPIPLWISDDGEEMVCVGSIEELERLTGQKVKDLHRETVDKLEIPSQMGKGVLRRIPEVFDCWFESGSMPYAQQHFPFENKKDFETCFPADFIGEGVDQTRGWFYTLTVLSTALFGKAPFKNLICNGLVLAADGQKMSKRKKNYPDPVEVINKYGADALRLYLINSPAVRAENLRFKEEGVRDVLKDVFLPWYNAFRFLLQNIALFEKNYNTKFQFEDPKGVDNTMDKWILSYSNSLVAFVKREMEAYRLYTVVPRLLRYIDNLTNWYVRMNRKRLKGDGGRADCLQSLQTLFSVLYVLNRLMAAFTPFLTEFMYQRQKPFLPEEEAMDSIHYVMLPKVDASLIDDTVERRVTRMQTVIELGRVLRDRKTLPLKYPLMEVVVIQREDEYISDLKVMETYILEELNVKKLTPSKDKQAFGVSMKAEPDIKALGLRLRNKSKEVGNGIRALSDADIQNHLLGKPLVVCGETLQAGDIRVQYSFASQITERYEAHSEGDVLVLLDVLPDEDMLSEGLAREVINLIQKLRKKAQLVPTDPISVFVSANPDDSMVGKVLRSHADFIKNTLKTPLHLSKFDGTLDLVEQETQELKDSKLTIVIGLPKGTKRTMERQATTTAEPNVSKKFCGDQENASKASKAPPTGVPACKFINVDSNGKKSAILLENPVNEGGVGPELLEQLTGSRNPTPTIGRINCKFVNVWLEGRIGTVLLENPVGESKVDVKRLDGLARTIFGVPSVQTLSLYGDAAFTKDLTNNLLEAAAGATVYAKRG